MNDYEARQAARKERLEQRAARARNEASARFGAVHATLDAIPMGQPILVGHHSERKHRNALERMDRNMSKGVEAAKDAERLERAAAGVGTGGISSDDPDAVAKLRDELERRKAEQERMKAARKTPGGLAMFPTYKITNNGAQIRRLEKRIAELEAKAADVTTRREFVRVEFDGRLVEGDLVDATVRDVAIVTDDVEANRCRIEFASKPNAETIALLKSRGFKWAPSVGDVGAWQRMRSNGATYAAGEIMRSLGATEKK